jgi:ecotin
MIKTLKKIFGVSLLAMCVLPLSQAADNMKAFPAADKGMVRHVLQVPAQDDETAFKVELIVGKTVEVDAHNRYFFGGQISTETIQGWGFERYLVKKLGPMAGTLMAIDPNAPKLARFVGIGGEPFLIRYNSRLPIVVYVPEGAQVRYRIWSAAPESKSMEKL